jgi:hypothetical protein
MSFGMMFLIFLAFMVAIFGFSFILSYFLRETLSGKTSIEIDSPEEALHREI